MGKVFSRSIVILLAITVFFYLSMLSNAVSQENTVRVFVDTKVNEFTDRVLKTGVVTCEEYETFIRFLDQTDVLFSVTMEHSHLTISPSSNGTDTISSWIVVSKKAILDELYSSGVYHLAKGDLFNVTVQNANNTTATVLKLQGLRSSVLHTIISKHGGTVRDES